jgi:hypothetical protein
MIIIILTKLSKQSSKLKEHNHAGDIIDHCIMFLPLLHSYLHKFITGTLWIIREIIRDGHSYSLFISNKLPEAIGTQNYKFVFGRNKLMLSDFCASYISKLILPGSLETPQECATRSPIERLMARPGELSYFMYTRCGPTDLTAPEKGSRSMCYATRPPDFSILILSSASSGLWSLLKG